MRDPILIGSEGASKITCRINTDATAKIYIYKTASNGNLRNKVRFYIFE